MIPTAVVADDDHLARERLKDLVAADPVVRVIGEAADGSEALRIVDELEPDVLFLDIEMPVFNGLEVAKRLRHRPTIVFTTAYGHYAVTAFELAAVDYLVKPFGPDRFKEAMNRVIGTLERPREESAERMQQAIEPGDVLERLFLRDKDRILPISVDQVIRCEAEGDYVDVCTSGRSFLVRLRLQDLEERLAGRFLRIHRSHLVNLDHVERFEQHDDARLAAVMSDGSRVVASRARSRDLRRLAR